MNNLQEKILEEAYEALMFDQDKFDDYDTEFILDLYDYPVDTELTPGQNSHLNKIWGKLQ